MQAITRHSARTDKQIEKEVDVLNVGDGYFETVNVRLVDGRAFRERQSSDAEESIIVNQEFVRTFELGNEPLEKNNAQRQHSRLYSGRNAGCVSTGPVSARLSCSVSIYDAENSGTSLFSGEPENLKRT